MLSDWGVIKNYKNDRKIKRLLLIFLNLLKNIQGERDYE